MKTPCTVIRRNVSAEEKPPHNCTKCYRVSSIDGQILLERKIWFSELTYQEESFPNYVSGDCNQMADEFSGSEHILFMKASKKQNPNHQDSCSFLISCVKKCEKDKRLQWNGWHLICCKLKTSGKEHVRHTFMIHRSMVSSDHWFIFLSGRISTRRTMLTSWRALDGSPWAPWKLRKTRKPWRLLVKRSTGNTQTLWSTPHWWTQWTWFWLRIMQKLWMK